MKTLGECCCCLGLAALFLVGSASAAEVKNLDELKDRISTSGPSEQAYYCAEMVRTLVEVANKQYSDGNYAGAQASIDEIERYAELAREATPKTHKLKQAEITLREAARRLEDIGKSLSMVDRPPVAKAVAHLHAVESELLKRLFSR